MAASYARVALAVLALVAATGATDRASLPITVEADSSDFDYKNGVLVFDRVRITQGDARVEAGRATATGLEFENSTWELAGGVRISLTDGWLQSDTARVRFRNNEITGAEVTGGPARFEQRRGDETAQGRAARIDYDLADGRVRLIGDAWLSDGRNEITGSTLVYSMLEQRVVAEAAQQGGQPVRIIINPRAPPGAPPGKDEPPADPGPDDPPPPVAEPPQ